MKKKLWKTYLYSLFISLILSAPSSKAMELDDSYSLNTLPGLPPEVREIIIGHLPHKDLLSLSMTSYSLKKEITDGTVICPNFIGSFDFVNNRDNNVKIFQKFTKIATSIKFVCNYSALFPEENILKKNFETEPSHYNPSRRASAFYQLSLLYRQGACRWRSLDLSVVAALNSLWLEDRWPSSMIEDMISSAHFPEKMPLEGDTISVINYKGEPLLIPKESLAQFTEQTNIAASSYKEFLDSSSVSPFSLEKKNLAFSWLGDFSLEILKDFKETFGYLLMRIYEEDSLAYNNTLLILRAGLWSPFKKTKPLIPGETHINVLWLEKIIGDIYKLNNKKTETLQWYKKSSQQGFPDSYLALVDFYTNVENNRKRRAKWLFKAAIQNLENCCTDSACEAFFKAANQGHKKALSHLKEMAHKGFPLAQYKLGLLYNIGQGTQQDQKKATKWYKKAAKKGHSHAQCLLGQRYNIGLGVQRNQEKSTHFLLLSMFQGDSMARKRLKEYGLPLGQSYHKEERVNRNSQKSLEWHQKAAAQREKDLKELEERAYKGSPSDQYVLGWMSFHGIGVPKDLEAARKWYQKAAMQKVLKAQHKLALMYSHGLGGVEDKEKAIELYKDLALVRYKNTFEIFKEMADTGSPKIQYTLGKWYEEGMAGLERNEITKDQSNYWYQKAGEQIRGLLAPNSSAKDTLMLN